MVLLNVLLLPDDFAYMMHHCYKISRLCNAKGNLFYGATLRDCTGHLGFQRKPISAWQAWTLQRSSNKLLHIDRRQGVSVTCFFFGIEFLVKIQESLRCRGTISKTTKHGESLFWVWLWHEKI